MKLVIMQIVNWETIKLINYSIMCVQHSLYLALFNMADCVTVCQQFVYCCVVTWSGIDTC
jgi:hypothetical protein